MTDELNTSNLSQELLGLVISRTGIGIWDWQVQTNEMTVNSEWTHQIGYRLDEVGASVRDFMSKITHPDDLDAARQRVESHFNGEVPYYQTELRLRHKAGHYVWIQVTGRVVERDDQGAPVRMIGTNQDISQRKNDEQTMVTTARLLDESQRIAKVGGWELDIASGHLFWTDETYRIHETSPEEFDPTVDAGVNYFLPESRDLISNALEAAMCRGEGYDLELETYTTKGRKIDVRTTGTVTYIDGKPAKITGIFQDISEQKNIRRNLEQTNLELEQLNRTLQNSAHYDALTNLPNRTLLADRMQQAMSRQQRHAHMVAIAFIDLDGFKEINDVHGHELGDKLLCRIAELVKGVLRQEDTLARFGGDEFVAVLDNLEDFDVCHQVLQRMLNSIRKPFVIDGQRVAVSASIGVTLFPQDNVMADQLIRHADLAMYTAKQRGKNQYYVFDVARDTELKHQHKERSSIRLAMSKQELVLHYQPKISLADGEVVGVEALLRWQHPTDGLLMPIAFLPKIEQDQLIIDIGEYVLLTAITQRAAWLEEGINMPISVNISPLQLQQNDFPDRIARILSNCPDYQHGDIVLEILETSNLSDLEQVANVIQRCEQLGVGFSIDDFGTGYSSLTYLKKLRAAQLKIDRSFVRDMLEDPDDEAIVYGIIELARAFELEVVAEGVETLEHGRKLYELGCEFAQGYGIARPMPPDQFPQWIQQWRSNQRWRSLFKNDGSTAS